ncbi:MAG: AraC family transcriptional regulator [Spirochaetaceae bacterium]
MKNFIFIYDYYMLLQGVLGPVKSHSHNAIQFFICNKPVKFKVNNQTIISSFLIVNSNVEHSVEFSANKLVTFLIDNESSISGHISQKILEGSAFKSLEKEAHLPAVKDINSAKTFISGILQVISIPKSCICSTKDSRIITALKIIDKSLEKKISISVLSKEVGLSEGRLIHLFKEEVGLPLRKYLLWLRLKDAIKLICTGKDLTYAAYETGFSDSAHLSRTFKSNFGLNSSKIIKHSQFIQFFS